MSNVIVVGDGKHDRATCVHWNQPFPNIEEFDSMIIDLTSFPKGIVDETVLKNLEELSKSVSTFMETNRNTYCIIAEPKNL